MFKVSRSGYYNWLDRRPSKRWEENRAISSLIRDIFENSFKSYGAPRVRTELLKKGYNILRPRVARIMSSNNLFARKKRRFKATTDSKHDFPIAPNILDRDFKVSRKNQVWVSDITYIETKQGWMYLTVIIDLFNRKVVGWSMSEDLGTERTIVPAWWILRTKLRRAFRFHCASDFGSNCATSLRNFGSFCASDFGSFCATSANPEVISVRFAPL